MKLIKSLISFIRSPRRWWLRRQSQRMILSNGRAKLCIIMLVAFSCLAASSPEITPKIKQTLQSPKAAGVQINAQMTKAAVIVPPKQIKLWWKYPVPLSSDLTFNIYSAHDLKKGFVHIADVDSPPATILVNGDAEYFICRTSNRITHQVSGWNIK